MSHTACVQDMFEYYLKSEIQTEYDEENIYFYTEYINDTDKNGYNPPEYLIVDGILHDIVVDALKDLGLDHVYEPDELNCCNITMYTVYVFDKIQQIVTKEELEDARMTYISAPLKKISDEPSLSNYQSEDSDQENDDQNNDQTMINIEDKKEE